jgi:hypothetical protein
MCDKKLEEIFPKNLVNYTLGKNKFQKFPIFCWRNEKVCQKEESSIPTLNWC